jgi:hypothetical protein
MKRLVVILMILLSFVFGACTVTTVNAKQEYPLKIWSQNQNSNYTTLNVIDENTGVNYIVVSATSWYGDKTTSVAITPRLNADGTLYVTK